MPHPDTCQRQEHCEIWYDAEGRVSDLLSLTRCLYGGSVDPEGRGGGDGAGAVGGRDRADATRLTGHWLQNTAQTCWHCLRATSFQSR